ncbi:Septin-4 [Ameca splendens]|uniref:Septin-4 n=1 Tax=Ameca splendens TaxID=208324 RepID=A0ABV0YBT0_9TELE
MQSTVYPQILFSSLTFYFYLLDFMYIFMHCVCFVKTIEAVENPIHSDFLLLRNMLVRTHMQDLKDVTRENHYENYRAQCIQSMTRMMVQERKRSLREKYREGSEVDFPLPLAAVDTDMERQIFEKDEELRKMQEVLERIQEQMQQSQSGSC